MFFGPPVSSTLTIKTSERRRRRSDVFIVNVEDTGGPKNMSQIHFRITKEKILTKNFLHILI